MVRTVPEKEDLRQVRDNVYKILSDLVRHEDERLSDTYNIFILVQTILLAGLLQLYTLDQSLYSSNYVLLFLKNILPLAGTLLNINGLYSLYKRLEAMGFWNERLYRLEADSDFIGEQYGGRLDIFTARKAYLKKDYSKYPRIIAGILKYQRYFMGVLFLIIWILALGAQLYSFL